MSTAAASAKPRTVPGKSNLRPILFAGAAVVVLVAMALDTKVVKIGSADDARTAAFSPAAYGESEFPRIKGLVEEKAVGAPALAEALAKDKTAAVKQYGVVSGGTPVFPVSFSGVAGDAKSGIYEVAVDGMPDGTKVRMQTGPAINGTELRDVTGTVAFGQFKNQIEYQNAGSALNNQMKASVLANVDTANLKGKKVKVVGAFRMINPKNWLVTPVALGVE